MNDLGGQTIKGYELKERIGAGGFGAVYRAYQPLLKREVAVNVILPEHANQPEVIRRFEVEAELVAQALSSYPTEKHERQYGLKNMQLSSDDL